MSEPMTEQALPDEALLHIAHAYRAFWTTGPTYMDLFHLLRRVRDLSHGIARPDAKYAPLRGEAVPPLPSFVHRR